MFSKKLVAVVILSAFLIYLGNLATVKAQQNPQNSEQLQNAINIVNNLSKVLAGMANILGNPAILLNGELGENVRSVVDDTNKIVVSLDTTLENLIAALGLEAG